MIDSTKGKSVVVNPSWVCEKCGKDLNIIQRMSKFLHKCK